MRDIDVQNSLDPDIAAALSRNDNPTMVICRFLDINRVLHLTSARIGYVGVRTGFLLP